MLRFVLTRIVLAVPTLLAAVTIVFFAIRVVPGDPAIAMLGDSASQASIDALRERMGLNQPLFMQYLDFLRGLLTGSLGDSVRSGRPVVSHIAQVLPYTLDLTIASVLIGVVVGIPFGVLAAVNRNRMPDYVTRVVSLLGLSFPVFFLGILLIMLFSIQLGWFPVISEGDLSDPLDRLRHLALPALAGSFSVAAFTTRATRSSLLEALGEDFIRTARAKGLPGHVVLFRHAFRNALIPVVTVVGLYLGLVIGNSVLIEIVFNRPGLGKLIVEALTQRDYAMLQGLIITYAFFIVIANLLTDLAYGFMDPRVKVQ
jgi:ABC-type dipeptide/oligopeptide/nickel transport system permease component